MHQEAIRTGLAAGFATEVVALLLGQDVYAATAEAALVGLVAYLLRPTLSHEPLVEDDFEYYSKTGGIRRIN